MYLISAASALVPILKAYNNVCTVGSLNNGPLNKDTSFNQSTSCVPENKTHPRPRVHIHVHIFKFALTLFPYVIFICLLLSCVQVCTTGYIANKPIKDPSTKAGLTIKRLLSTDFHRIGKGLAVMLVFNQPPSLGVCVVTQ